VGRLSPPHGVWGGGCAPSPENFLIFELKKTSLGAFWVIFLQFNGNWSRHCVACTDWIYMISNIKS